MSTHNNLPRLTGLAGFMLFNCCIWIVSGLVCMPTIAVGQVAAGTDSSSAISNGILEPVTLAMDPTQSEQSITVKRRIEEIKIEIASVIATAERADEDMRSLEKQIKLMGLTSSNQLVLIETRRGLPSISENQLRIKAISDELDQIALNMHRLETSSSDDLHSRLIERYSEYRIQLGNLSVERERLIAKIILLRQFLNGQLMWVRDCPPIGIAEFKKTAEGVTALTAPGQWIELGKGLAERVFFRPYEFGLLAIGLVAITFAKRWLAK